MKTVYLCYFVLFCTVSAELPSWIKPCSKDNANLNKCFVESSAAAIQVLAKGDQKLQIPNFFPLKHPGVKYDPNNEFHLQIKETDVVGMDSLTITEANVDLKGKTINMKFIVPKTEWTGTYIAKALKENEEVSGKSYFKFDNCAYTAKMDYDVKDNHIAITKFDVKFEKKNIVSDLENLDAHEKVKTLYEKNKSGFDGVVLEALGQFLSLMFSAVFKTATYDEIFP